MDDMIEKTCVGLIGYVSSVTIVDINAILSAIVAALTIVYLCINIWRKLREEKK